MPSSATSVQSRRRAHAMRSAASSRRQSAIVSQPSRLATSGVPSGAQSVASFDQIRRATFSSAALRTRSAIGALEVVGDRAGDRRGPAGDDRLALGLHARQQPVQRALERLDPVAQQLVGDVVEVEARLRQRGRSSAGSWSAVGPVISARSAAASSVAIGIVLTVWGADQLVDVHRVRVGRVLHAGRRPQRALERRARVAQRRVALALEELLEALVGAAGVGQARPARRGRVRPISSSRLSASVSTRETKNDATECTSRLAGLQALLQSADVGLGDPLVGGDAEQQRDVDVDARRRSPPRSPSTPSSVPGILIITFGRSTSAHSRLASASVRSPSRARAG